MKSTNLESCILFFSYHLQKIKKTGEKKVNLSESQLRQQQ